MKKYEAEVTATVEVWADDEETARMLAQGYVFSLTSFKSIRLVGISEGVSIRELS